MQASGGRPCWPAGWRTHQSRTAAKTALAESRTVHSTVPTEVTSRRGWPIWTPMKVSPARIAAAPAHPQSIGRDDHRLSSEGAGVDQVRGLLTQHELAGWWPHTIGGPLLQGAERVLEARQHRPHEVGELAVKPLEVGAALDLVQPGEP